MTAELSASLLVVCGFLVAVSAIQRYASNFIIPGVTIMMFIGAISIIVPLYSLDIKTVYDSIEKSQFPTRGLQHSNRLESLLIGHLTYSSNEM